MNLTDMAFGRIVAALLAIASAAARPGFHPRRYCNERVLILNPNPACKDAEDFCNKFNEVCQLSKYEDTDDRECIAQADWIQNFADVHPDCVAQ
jgi:hypothetical protein